MRILWSAIILVAACGPKHTAPAKDFTLHDKLLVQGADGVIAINAETGAVTPVTGEAIDAAIWAGRCVVYLHGDGQVSVVDPVTGKQWDLDDGASALLYASPDGTKVTWSCTGDDGEDGICETLVDNTGDVEIVEAVPWREHDDDPNCWAAGPDHELCKTERGLRMADGTEAYLDPHGALYVIRGGATARKLAAGPFDGILDWRP